MARKTSPTDAAIFSIFMVALLVASGLSFTTGQVEAVSREM